MASIISHPAVPLALSVALGTDRIPPALTAAACAASVLPDIDALGFAAGVPYGHTFGHRGFTHSLFFALMSAVFCSLFAKRLGATPWTVFAMVFVAAASHGFLDALTNGGMGVAFFSPFSNRRYFLPWHVILVSPIGVSRFVSERGLRVLRSELVWIWLPCSLVAILGLGVRKLARWG
jgi:inner membrane protein